MTSAYNYDYTRHDPDTAPDAIDFVLRLTKAWGFDVRFTDNLSVPYAADRDAGTILLPNGLPWRHIHARLDRSFIYMIGGSRWAREFQPQSPAEPAPSDVIPNNVTPLIRRPR